MLHVQLFGRFRVRSDEVVSDLEACKAQELFSYLLLHSGRSHAREALAGLLWGDSSTGQARKYLRQALWQLQAALDPGTQSSGNPVLVVEPEWIHINADARLWLDVADFERAFDRTEGISGRDLDPEAMQSLRDAIELYQGDLLEGWYQDWCLYERERLQNMYLAMLDKLMGYAEARQEYETALMYGCRILRLDRARERTHAWLMRLQYLAGDRTGALRQFERCVAALEEELGVEPARRTVALYERIRADRGVDSVAAPDSPELREAASSLVEALGRVEQLGTVLADVQLQIKQLRHDMRTGQLRTKSPS